jgi:hypothetical protein
MANDQDPPKVQEVAAQRLRRAYEPFSARDVKAALVLMHSDRPLVPSFSAARVTSGLAASAGSTNASKFPNQRGAEVERSVAYTFAQEQNELRLRKLRVNACEGSVERKIWVTLKSESSISAALPLLG